MAGGFDNTNRGVLFKQDKLSDNQPDYKGSVDVEGVQYWFSGWIKTAGPNAQKPGSKFLSVSVQKKDAQQAPKKAGSTPHRPNFDDLDDTDIPFSYGVA